MLPKRLPVSDLGEGVTLATLYVFYIKKTKLSFNDYKYSVAVFFIIIEHDSQRLKKKELQLTEVEFSRDFYLLYLAFNERFLSG